MPINIDIKSEDIEQAVVQAITDSSIGETIKTTIHKMLTERNWNAGKNESVLEIAIRNEVEKIIGTVIKDEIQKRKEDIVRVVGPLVTDDVINEMTSATWEIMLGRIRETRRL